MRLKPIGIRIDSLMTVRNSPVHKPVEKMLVMMLKVDCDLSTEWLK
jgi:hypothetical protein